MFQSPKLPSSYIELLNLIFPFAPAPRPVFAIWGICVSGYYIHQSKSGSLNFFSLPLWQPCHPQFISYFQNRSWNCPLWSILSDTPLALEISPSFLLDYGRHLLYSPEYLKMFLKIKSDYTNGSFHGFPVYFPSTCKTLASFDPCLHGQAQFQHHSSLPCSLSFCSTKPLICEMAQDPPCFGTLCTLFPCLKSSPPNFQSVYISLPKTFLSDTSLTRPWSKLRLPCYTLSTILISPTVLIQFGIMLTWNLYPPPDRLPCGAKIYVLVTCDYIFWT